MFYEKSPQGPAILNYYKSQIPWSYDKNFVLNLTKTISSKNAYLSIYIEFQKACLANDIQIYNKTLFWISKFLAFFLGTYQDISLLFISNFSQQFYVISNIENQGEDLCGGGDL